jgi:hypothetical protein
MSYAILHTLGKIIGKNKLVKTKSRLQFFSKYRIQIQSTMANLQYYLNNSKKNKLNDWQVIEFKQLGLITLLQQFCNSYSLYIFVQLN